MPATDHLHEEQVTWAVDDIPVYATLARPVGAGPLPAVALVAGSGPTDRDWNSPLIPGANGSGRLLAQALAARGYVTLRYDKRASGPHIRENVGRMAGKISMRGHAEELAGAIRLLAGRPEVDPRRIFALTNSEGAIHALNYQRAMADPPCAGLLLTAPPARAIRAVARGQIVALLQASPGGAELLPAFDAAVAAFESGQPVAVDERLPEGARMLLLSLTAPANLPFTRELWATEPAALLADLDTPALVLIGKKDLQVDWQADGALFTALAARRPGISVAFPENANHVLKYEPRPRAELDPATVAAGYNSDACGLDPDALAAIAAWLDEHGGRA